MKLELQRPNKELWPGVTKVDLARHMILVANQILPHLKDRPLTLVRAPDGIDGPRFFQKDAHHLASHLDTCHHRDIDYTMVHNHRQLIHLADQAAIELHGWTSRCDRPDTPDRLVFDFDPTEGEHFDEVRHAARDLCRLIRNRGGTPFPMITGGKGIHVLVPLERSAAFPEVIAFTDTVARVLARNDPLLTTEVRKDKRAGRIFIDTLRNRPRQTAVLPWSARLRPGAPFAAPITIDDLDDVTLHPRAARIGDTERWLQRDAWRGYAEAAVPLSRLT